MVDCQNHFASAIQADPNLAEAHFNLGLALNKLNLQSEATAHFKEQPNSHPPTAQSSSQAPIEAARLLHAGPGGLVLKFPGYLKPGDSLGLTFDTAVKSLGQIDVATYLDSPQSPVTLRVGMQSLPDGTRYPGSVVLGMPASQIEVRITNSNYQKLAP